MALVKTQQEIELIKKSCQILAEVKKVIYDLIRPGVSLKELDSIAFKEIVKRGAKPAFKGYMGFPATICASLNEELIHGIPNERVLKEDDLISIDIGVIYKGYYSDSAFSKSLSPENEENAFLINVAKVAFEKGIKAIKKGATIGDIGYAIGKYLDSQKVFTPREYSGHGIGSALHESPYVFNRAPRGSGMKIRNNMVICIEPMILQKSPQVYTKEDNWTVVAKSGLKSSHYEHTVLIQDWKAIVLTKDI
ncbi:type I methionyl aminopeptidase [Mycoplasmopsis pulmonis]|uniref:type I methionyl aminopeptidase n=1 Tax=Mycoplasmopsis pulmonis TaxID=2107 RepID=UPI001004F949|nr:type I methionyl aminopeptidase [Mycoplasmopsis pulmonis]VEU68330.1 Methionine aminopeptidase [Mycoplasmopsis pulmonis]